jgi:hypothetical protein
MALLHSEIIRCRYELGYTNLTSGAYPWLSNLFAEFENIVTQYLDSGATTTSSTVVAAQPLGTAPQPVTLTLSSATGFSAKNRVTFDIDAAQEDSVVESVSGSTIVVFSRLAHTGTYPVTVEGGEQIVRDILRRLARVSSPTSGRMEAAAASAGVAKATTVEFFPAGGAGKSKSRLDEMYEYQTYLRNELARALGVQNLSTGYGGSGSGGGASTSEMY